MDAFAFPASESADDQSGGGSVFSVYFPLPASDYFQIAITIGAVRYFPASLHKRILRTGLEFQLVRMYNDHVSCDRSIPGIATNEYQQGDALFYPPSIWLHWSL